MSALTKQRYSVEEYLALERDSQTRHEYYLGEIHQMAGDSFKHNRIVGNIFGNLFTALKGKPCVPLTSEMRLKVTPIRFTYPDVQVVCGTPQFDDNNPPSLLNPTVIIEVASPSTQDHDMGKKALDIRQMESVQEYVVILQDEARAVHYIRYSGGVWRLIDLVNIQATLYLTSISCTLSLADVYDGVVMGA